MYDMRDDFVTAGVGKRKKRYSSFRLSWTTLNLTKNVSVEWNVGSLRSAFRSTDLNLQSFGLTVGLANVTCWLRSRETEVKTTRTIFFSAPQGSSKFLLEGLGSYDGLN